MKTHFFLFSLLSLAPLAASAQTKLGAPTTTAPRTAPQVSVDPTAKALLDKATATYKGLNGLRFDVATIVDGQETGTSNIAFSRPNLVSIERRTKKSSLRLLLDGSDFYQVRGTSYRKGTPPAGLTATQLIAGAGTLTSNFISAMLEGKNPLNATQDSYTKPPFQNFKSNTVALAPFDVDGETLSGVQSTYSFDIPGRDGKARSINQQITAYFGGSPLTLRRTRVVLTQNKTVTIIEKVVDQQLNPTFAADTFKFNATGLTLASEQEESSFDPRLKVGAQPFAFSAKTLNGQAISPANYKGKVLLMDFWATWCGPCVASLPELKSVYDKYHAQGLEVVGVSLDGDKDALTSFIKENKMPWPQVFNGQDGNPDVAATYGVRAIPFMLIVGKNGQISAVNPRDDLEGAVKAALAVR